MNDSLQVLLVEDDPDVRLGCEQALQLGLIDHLGTLDYVAREVVKAEEVIDYTPQENVAERLAKRFGASIGAGAVKALRELPAVK